MSRDEVKEILCQQLEMLAEKSKECQNIDDLVRVSGEMDRIANTILRSEGVG